MRPASTNTSLEPSTPGFSNGSPAPDQIHGERSPAARPLSQAVCSEDRTSCNSLASRARGVAAIIRSSFVGNNVHGHRGSPRLSTPLIRSRRASANAMRPRNVGFLQRHRAGGWRISRSRATACGDLDLASPAAALGKAPSPTHRRRVRRPARGEVLVGGLLAKLPATLLSCVCVIVCRRVALYLGVHERIGQHRPHHYDRHVRV